jgi:hypothetical protein
MNEYSVTYYVDEEKTQIKTEKFKYDTIFDLSMELAGKHLYAYQFDSIQSIILLPKTEVK